MTINELDQVDFVAENEKEVILIISEYRKWDEIDNADKQLAKKIAAYKYHVTTQEFKNKHSGKKIRYLIRTQFPLPQKLQTNVIQQGFEIQEGI